MKDQSNKRLQSQHPQSQMKHHYEHGEEHENGLETREKGLPITTTEENTPSTTSVKEKHTQHHLRGEQKAKEKSEANLNVPRTTIEANVNAEDKRTTNMIVLSTTTKANKKAEQKCAATLANKQHKEDEEQGVQTHDSTIGCAEKTT